MIAGTIVETGGALWLPLSFVAGLAAFLVASRGERLPEPVPWSWTLGFCIPGLYGWLGSFLFLAIRAEKFEVMVQLSHRWSVLWPASRGGAIIVLVVLCIWSGIALGAAHRSTPGVRRVLLLFANGGFVLMLVMFTLQAYGVYR